MQYSLKLIDKELARELKKIRPQDLRRSIVECDSNAQLIIADLHWIGRSIDIQVGDIVLVPANSQQNGASIKFHQNCEQGDLFIAVSPGISQIRHLESVWSIFVRISRRGYTGRSIYRHLEDPEYG